MNMKLIRKMYLSDGIFSDMYSDDNQKFCVTLEHAYDDGEGAFCAKLPSGVYTCRRRLSPHFGYELFQILNVPNANFIEIHRGNVNKDSEGCILLGDQQTRINGVDMILNSKETFEKFMRLQADVNEFQLTVID